MFAYSLTEAKKRIKLWIKSKLYSISQFWYRIVILLKFTEIIFFFLRKLRLELASSLSCHVTTLHTNILITEKTVADEVAVNFISATFWFSIRRINDNRNDHGYFYGLSSRQNYLAVKITGHGRGYRCSINLIKHESDVTNGSVKTEFQLHWQHS
jgi:hypothetical protein